MAQSSVQLIVDASKALTPLKQTEQATRKLESAVNDANGRLRDSKGRFIGAGQEAERASKKVDLLTAGLKRLAAQLVLADLARRYFQGFNEAEKAAAAVRTLGVNSDVLEKKLLDVSNRLGGLYSQTQLLAASYDVASAGFANAADNAKVLEAAALGATGGLSDLNTVGNALTSVLNSYGKSADEASKLVDGFIQTQNDGKIVLNEYAQQIGRLAPTAAAAGVGIDELNAAVATITAQGVPVEATFTGLNQALVSILKPSKEASDLAEALGIQFNESGLRAKGFGGLLEEVKTKTGGSTTQLVKLFGSVDALKVVLPLVNDDLVKFNKNLGNQTQAAGTAKRATADLGGTVSSEITKMVNQIGNLTRALDTVLGPVLGTVIKLINDIIARATEGINLIGRLVSLSPNKALAAQAIQQGGRGAMGPRVLMGIDELIGGTRRQQLQKQAGAGTGFLGLGMNQEKFIELLRKEPAVKNLLGTQVQPQGSQPKPPVDPAIQELLDRLAAGSSNGGGSRTRKPQKTEEEKEAEKKAEALKQQAEAGKQLLQSLQDQTSIATALTDDERRRLQLAIDKQQIDRDYPLLTKEARDVLKEQLDVLYGTENVTASIKDLNEANAKKQADALSKQQQEAQRLEQIYGQLGQTIATGVTDMLTAAMDKTKSLAEVASNMLRNLANQLLQVAVNTALFSLFPGSSLFKSLPRFADGGSISGGKPAIVGERGPELFMPGRSGSIIPNNAMGGANIVVNVDASGSSVQGDTNDSKRLGEAIGVAVRQELIKQKRPGGLLA